MLITLGSSHKIYLVYRVITVLKNSAWEIHVKSCKNIEYSATNLIFYTLYTMTPPPPMLYFLMSRMHRRRINTEEKAQVVAACLGDSIYSILCRASYFAPGRLEESDEFILFFKSSWCKIARAARNWSNSVPLTEAATTFAFSSVFILLL